MELARRVLDLVFRNATVADGSGGPPCRASVGVADGQIATLEADGLAASEVIDADGLLLTPGFVDIHTHYDGQATWDAELRPSSSHGVTTLVTGNCGVGFAPCRPTDRERLVELMEGVEDIPGSALSAGLRWDWTDFPSYLDALAATPRTVDVLAQVPHDALRVWVMGERASAHEAATPNDVVQMAAALGAALDAGAAGFSTGRTDNHRSARGAPTPASEADAAELAGLGAVFAGRGRGVLQAVSDFDLALGPDAFAPEFERLMALARPAVDRPLLVSVVDRDGAPGHADAVAHALTRAAATGLDLRAVVAPRAIGVVLGLRTTFHPFIGVPTWRSLLPLSHEERVAALRRPEVRHRMLTETSLPVAGDGSPVPPLADRLLARLDRLAWRLFRLSDPPDYEPPPSASLGAEVRSGDVRATLLDALLEEDGHRLLYFPIFNYASGNLDAVRAQLHHPLALPGLSDGGAHVGTICDAGFPTFLIHHQVRDRQAMTLGAAVRSLTSAPAAVYGLTDRGRIAVGKRADLNLVDLARLGCRRPELVRDLPGGGTRLVQEAVGMVGTWVAGVRVACEGRLTGARPGRLVRL
jgi:N-acyl-D-aspartate/D-glutamate deacylase